MEPFYLTIAPIVMKSSAKEGSALVWERKPPQQTLDLLE